MDDAAALLDLNTRFIDAFRQGSWELLQPILSPDFAYLDGSTGELWDRVRYAADLEVNPEPTIAIDQIVVHIDGNTATVSARSSKAPGSFSRYVDTYERRDGAWVCVHACVWPLRRPE